MHNPIQRQQAPPRRAVMAGAEGERGLDLDADAVGRDRRPVVRAMHREAAGDDRPEIAQARGNPIRRRDGFERERRACLGSGRFGDTGSHRRLVGRRGEVGFDAPSGRALERRHGSLEAVHQPVGDAPCRRLVAGEAGERGVI